MEVDLCSRYEAFTKHFKTKDATKETQELAVAAMALPPMNVVNVTIKEVGTGSITPLAQAASVSWSIWEVDAAFSTLDTAGDITGIKINRTMEIKTEELWNPLLPNSTMQRQCAGLDV